MGFLCSKIIGVDQLLRSHSLSKQFSHDVAQIVFF